MTESQLLRLQRDWEDAAKEPVKIEDMKGLACGLTTELGALRLLAYYTTNGRYHNPKIRVGFSVNLKSWYFSLEMSHSDDAQNLADFQVQATGSLLI